MQSYSCANGGIDGNKDRQERKVRQGQIYAIQKSCFNKQGGCNMFGMVMCQRVAFGGVGLRAVVNNVLRCREGGGERTIEKVV